MRKVAQRKLRDAFRAATGKEASGLIKVETDDDGRVAYVPSAWRRLKKAHKAQKGA